MKKIIRIVIIIAIIVLSGIFSLSYIINNNKNYETRMIDRISNHYKTDNITYANMYNNYYIITTNDNVIVLDNEYKEVLKEKLSSFKENKDNYAIVYKTNKLMYEKTTLEKDKIIYTYYDAKSGKEIKKTTMEK